MYCELRSHDVDYLHRPGAFIRYILGTQYTVAVHASILCSAADTQVHVELLTEEQMGMNERGECFRRPCLVSRQTPGVDPELELEKGGRNFY